VNVSKVSIAVVLAVSVFALSACSGATGVAGARGSTGAAGAVGSAGAPGKTGPAGAAGAIGATGSEGSPGAAGATGPAGETGATGSKGSPGAAGATGPAGATGSAGAGGPTGPAGATGPAGTAGRDGADGVSGYAYIYNLDAQNVAPETGIAFSDNGYMSTEFAHTPGTSSITITSGGVYSVSFSVSVPGLLAIELNWLPVRGGIYGSAGGASMLRNSGVGVVTASAGDILTIATLDPLSLQQTANLFGANTNASVIIEKVG
jgi:hypothetical protein